MSFQESYQQGVRKVAARSIGGLARTRVTPNQLTALGVTLCAVGALLVTFENRNELLYFWAGAAAFIVGSILDILDGALARVGGKQSAFGAFLDSLVDRVGEGLMLAAVALVLARDGNLLAVALTAVAIAGSFLVPYARAKAEALGFPGRRRDRLARGARRRHLGRADPRPVGRASVGDRAPRGDRVGDRRPARSPRAASCRARRFIAGLR